MREHKATDDEKEALEKYLIQFLNFEKRYPLLPGIKNQAAIADLMGLDLEELTNMRERFTDNAKKAALELLEEEEVTTWVDELPFEKNDTIVALGDSMTDDLQGWFAIMEHVLELTVPEANFHCINAGIADNTTTDALKRLNRDVLSKEPDWVIVALGTFDAQKLHVDPDRTLTSLADFWENINAIQEAVEEVTDNPVIWITPPPVITEMIQQIPMFNFSIYEEDLSQIREIINGKVGYIVDPKGERMGGTPPEAWYYLSDGLHPSLSGQLNTTRELIRTLALGSAVGGSEGAEFKSEDDEQVI